MIEFSWKTKNGNEPVKNQRKVYFTCHPADFSLYFEKLTEDILRTHDVAILYTEDMTTPIPPEDRDSTLGQMNLFIVPVTHRLLTEPNRAMNTDLAYAKAHGRSILPFMMEPDIDELYQSPTNFGERQYLEPYSHDLTAIPYAEKLKKFLDTSIISDALVKRIQKEFDAYIFLSYRKKDRRHANELMRLIHAHPECRDIAIWYDEFLTPSESFRENIQKYLDNSKLFTLLVTPNLLEPRPDGSPNFVVSEEYPAARTAAKTILPAEMLPTNHSVLLDTFADLPECIDPRNDAAFKERLLKTLETITISNNEQCPEHNYLIGLAYLDGIDVEVNRERAIELITSAAEAGLPEAMKKLGSIYRECFDFLQSILWEKRYLDYGIANYGEEHPAVLEQMATLAVFYYDIAKYEESLALEERVYQICLKLFGPEHPATLGALTNLSATYNNMENPQKALELLQKVYALQRTMPGEPTKQILATMQNLAVSYSRLGQTEQALAFDEDIYTLRRKLLGEYDLTTVDALNNLATTLRDAHQPHRALPCAQRGYELRCRLLPENHPDTLSSLMNLSVIYSDLGQHEKALELAEQAYPLMCTVLGEHHPSTLTALSTLASAYSNIPGNQEKSLQLHRQAYEQRCSRLGQEHPDTLTALYNFAHACFESEQPEEARNLAEKAHALYCKVFGDSDARIINTGNLLHAIYSYTEEYNTALYYAEITYNTAEKHKAPDALRYLQNLTVAALEADRFRQALAYAQKAYTLEQSAHGNEHRDTQLAHMLVGLAYSKQQIYPKALKVVNDTYGVCRQLWGKNDALTIRVKQTLSEITRNAKKHKGIQRKEQRYLKLQEVLPADNMLMMKLVTQIAFEYRNLADYKHAVPYFKKLLGIVTMQSEHLGQIHPSFFALQRELVDVSLAAMNADTE